MTARWLTVPQYAERWQLSPQSVRRRIRSGRIPGAVNVGTESRHDYRIPADAIPGQPAGTVRRRIRKHADEFAVAV